MLKYARLRENLTSLHTGHGFPLILPLHSQQVKCPWRHWRRGGRHGRMHTEHETRVSRHSGGGSSVGGILT